MDSHALPKDIALSSQLKEGSLALVAPELPLLKQLLSPAPTDKDSADINVPAKKKHRCQAKVPQKESHRSTTNAGTHRQRRAHATKKNEGGHRCTQDDHQAVLASSLSISTFFNYSSIKVQTGGYGGIYLGSKACIYPHGNVEELISHGYTLISWDGKSSLLKSFLYPLTLVLE
jgi:hypothetical protein